MKRVAIIGAGLAGPAMALALIKETNIRDIVLYEIRDFASTMGGSINLSPNGLRILDYLGILKELEKRTYVIKTVTVTSETGSILGFRPLGDPERYGYGAMRIKRADLQKLLLDGLEKEGIKVMYSKSIKEIDESGDGVKMTFVDGSIDNVDILIGADGIHSSVRKICKINESVPKYTGLVGIYGSIKKDVLKSKDLSLIENVDMVSMLGTTGGMTGIAYSAPDKSELYAFTSMPQSEEPDRPSFIVDDKFKGRLRQKYQNWVEPVPTIIENLNAVTGYAVYKLVPFPEEWISSTGKVILIGDAAHAMSPHAGQGMGMGLEDSIVLAKVLAKYEPTRDNIVEKYQGLCKPRVLKFYHEATRNSGLRANKSGMEALLFPMRRWFNLRKDSWNYYFYGNPDWAYDVTKLDV